MMKPAKISIIIPCYNQEKHIGKCLDSIVSQPFSDYEIIAVDDGSRDGTLKILKEYERKDKKIKVFTVGNMGAGAARNYGLKRAQGNFVFFMDSDDFLEKDALSVLAAVTDREIADIYFFNFYTYDDRSAKIDERILFKNQEKRLVYEGGECGYSRVRFEDKKEFFMWSYVAPWNKIYRRGFITDNRLEFDEIFSTNDRTFYFSSLIKSESIVTLDSTLINYRINNQSSLTGSYNFDKFENRKYAYESSIKWIDKEDEILWNTFFKVTVLDFVSFYQRSRSGDKYALFLKTLRFFKNMDTRNVTCISDSEDIAGFYYRFFTESDYLLSLECDSVVPVVFASNDKYLPYLSVTLRSLEEHSQNGMFYDLYILHTGISELNRIKICRMSTPNIHVRSVDVSCLVKRLPLYSKGHFSVEMYYRILIADLLWQYRKVLYLDCDTVLNTDAKEILELDIGRAIIGAVRNPLDKDMNRYVTGVLGMSEEEYFNSGMLIIDTDLFKRHGIKNKCFELLLSYSKLACPDQDVLNLSCRGNCAYLDEKWNFQTGNHSYTDEYKYSVLEDLKLIHFTTGNKPWNKRGLALSEEFWKYARKTPFYEDIILVYTDSVVKKSIDAASENQRTLINGMNMRHYEVINPGEKEKRKVVSWPLRMIAKFFSHWRRYGLRSAVRKIPDKLRYVKKRIFGGSEDSL